MLTFLQKDVADKCDKAGLLNCLLNSPVNYQVSFRFFLFHFFEIEFVSNSNVSFFWKMLLLLFFKKLLIEQWTGREISFSTIHVQVLSSYPWLLSAIIASFRRREVITAFARLYARSHKTVLSSYLSLICRTTSNFQIKVMKHMLVNTQFKDSPSPWQIQNCVIFFPMEQKSILSNTTGDGNENTFV